MDNNKAQTKKETVTAFFPGIGNVEISKERAAQILRLQQMIREDREQKAKQINN